jgi:hypothetical protein
LEIVDERARLLECGNITAKEDGSGRPRNELRSLLRRVDPGQARQDETADPARELFHVR